MAAATSSSLTPLVAAGFSNMAATRIGFTAETVGRSCMLQVATISLVTMPQTGRLHAKCHKLARRFGGMANPSVPPWGVLGLPGGRAAVPARLHEPGLVGDDHQLCPVPRSQLQHGAADVGLGGGRTDIEPSGDLGVGQSFPD